MRPDIEREFQSSQIDKMTGGLFGNLSRESLIEMGKALAEKGVLSGSLNSNLSKSIQATDSQSMTNLDQLTGGRAITMENIDSTIKMVVEQQSDIMWTKTLRESKAYAVLDQWMEINDYGTQRRVHAFGKARSESDFPIETNTGLGRKTDQVKFLRDLRTVSHVFESQNTYASGEELQNRGAALTLTKANELMTVYGDSEIIPYEYDGLIKQIEAADADGAVDAVIDARDLTNYKSQGTEISETLADRAIEAVYNAGGRVSYMFHDTEVQASLNNVLPQERRFLSNYGGPQFNQTALGAPAMAMRSPYAYANWGGSVEPHVKFKFAPDYYMPSGKSPMMKAPLQAELAGYAPNAPASVTTAVNTGVAGSKFATGDAGDYFYRVSAISEDGESASVAIGAAATVAANGSIVLTITGNDPRVTGYNVFRSVLDASDASDCRWIGSVKRNGVETTFTDLNENLPGTSRAFLLSTMGEQDAIDYRRLVPFMRIPLAFGLGGTVGYPFLYLDYRYLRITKTVNPVSGYPFHVMIKNLKPRNSDFIPA